MFIHWLRLPRDGQQQGLGCNLDFTWQRGDKLALDTLRGLIADAVLLDEDAYTNTATLQHYHQRLQSQHRRILQVEAEVEDAARQQEAFVKQRAQTRVAEAQVQELQQELENNAVVFDMHYNELLLKNEEIERLKTVIEGLGGGS